jgi:hypothetical protein
MNDGMKSLKGTDRLIRHLSLRVRKKHKNTSRIFRASAEFLSRYVPSDVRIVETSSKSESL